MLIHRLALLFLAGRAVIDSVTGSPQPSPWSAIASFALAVLKAMR